MSKYTDIETGWVLDTFVDNASPPTVVPVPQNVAAIPRVLTNEIDGSLAYTLDVSWLPPSEPFVTSYYVEFKRGADGIWGNRQEVTITSARYENIGAGTFYARVASVVPINNKISLWTTSEGATLTITQYLADFQVPNHSVLAVDF